MSKIIDNNDRYMKLGYQPALDGVRAIAVVLVMFLHAHFQLANNGQIGVSLFFSMSGFLITTLLYEEFRNTGSISFSGFYLRRTFRLFPALFVLLAVCIIYVAWFVNDPIRKGEIWKEIYASALYVYNISWSWDWGKGSLLLGHTWSLAVEEQFYLIWPWILIWFLKKDWLKLLMWILFGFISLSWLARSFGWTGSVYQSLVQESIFMGCFFALIRLNDMMIKISDWFLLFLVSVICILGLIPVDSPINLFNPIGLIGGVLFIGLTQNQHGLTARLLSIKPLVFIGKISYGMYLWHLPVFRWFSYHAHLPGYQAFLGKFLITFLLTYLSWMLIEKRSTRLGRALSDKIKTGKNQ